MSCARPAIRAEPARRGPVMGVAVARARDATPREAGAARPAWPDHIAGTIGGGMPKHRATGAPMPRAARHAPAPAEDLIVTFSHGIAPAPCHALPGRSAGSIGPIESATERARFRARLRQLDHCEAAIARPIDDPGFGKQPQAIAVGVAAGLLTEQAMRERQVG